jgi:hypothetical protein
VSKPTFQVTGNYCSSVASNLCNMLQVKRFLENRQKCTICANSSSIFGTILHIQDMMKTCQSASIAWRHYMRLARNSTINQSWRQSLARPAANLGFSPMWTLSLPPPSSLAPIQNLPLYSHRSHSNSESCCVQKQRQDTDLVSQNFRAHRDPHQDHSKF